MDAAKLLRNRVHQESSSRGREKINAVSKNYDFCENGQLYNSAENTVFWARSNFNGFANFGPLMTNDGAFESSHQGEVILNLLASTATKMMDTRWSQARVTTT